MKSEKANQNKRMSLDPSKNTTFNFTQKNHASQLQVRKNAPQESLVSISNHEQYCHQDLGHIFDSISEGKDRITVQDLYVILNEEGYSDSQYSAVQMIALVDEERKGYLNKKEFINYFSSKNYVDEEKTPQLTPQMIQDQKWVKAIDENWQFFKEFQDKQYCNWVAEKLKEHKKQKKNQ